MEGKGGPKLMGCPISSVTMPAGHVVGLAAFPYFCCCAWCAWAAACRLVTSASCLKHAAP